jgi:hypothetical protein
MNTMYTRTVLMALFLAVNCAFTVEAGNHVDDTAVAADDPEEVQRLGMGLDVLTARCQLPGLVGQLAGGIAEVVSGKSWDELIRETYREPCDAQSVGYTNQYAQSFTGSLGGLAYPSFFSGDVATLPETANPNIEGGAYTQVRDYGEILLMHLRGGLCGENRVLSEESVARMQEDRIGELYDGATPTGSGYGFGWWVDRQEPGVVTDPGAYGAMPWLDVPRGYGAMILIESGAMRGEGFLQTGKAILDAVFDAE